MRIPSQLNEDSLYRRRPRRGENADTYRKLVRMLIGLALVLVVMRQAARPAIYQTFFGPQPAGQAVIQGQTTAQVFVETEKEPQVPSPPLVIDPQDRVIASAIIAELRVSDRRQWLVALSRWQSGRPVEMVPSTVDSVRLALDGIDSIEADRRAVWLEMIESLQQCVASADGGRPDDVHLSALSAWITALDDAAAAKVVDGSVWRSGDFETFYRYLDQAPTMSAENLAATGVLPLLQQPDVYRTQLVRVSGGVARAERYEAQENPFGIREYWELWLRPSDGADRPLLVIVPSVPPLVESVGADASEQEGPQVTMVGRFLKRLAYPSKAGADLAPVVVGRLITAPVTQAEMAATNNVTARDSAESTRFLLIVGLAVFVGVLLSALAMWRTAVAAKRSREVRSSHRKQPNLSGLKSQLPEERS